MLRDHHGRPRSLFDTLRHAQTQNLDAVGLNDLSEAFSSFLTRARYFSTSLRRTWSHSALEFMKYRRRLPSLLAAEFGSGSATTESMSTSAPSSQRLEAKHKHSKSPRSCDPCKVFVSNIDYRVTPRQLASFFSKFGKVVSCHQPQDSGGTLGRNRSRGIAYVTYNTEAEAERAKQALPEDLTYYGRVMTVAQAIPVTKRHSVHQGSSDVVDSESESAHSPSSLEASWTSASPIMDLPDAMLVRIFEKLGIADRVRIERVCKRFLEQACNAWTKTQHLSFENMFSAFRGRPLKNPTLKQMLRRCGRYLCSIDISAAPHLLDEHSLQLISDACSDNLLRVNLTGLRVRWSAIRRFAENCTLLEEIVLRDSYTISERGFWYLLRNCKQAKRVDISGCRLLSGKCFRLLGLATEELVLNGCLRLEAVGIEELCRQGVNLRVLELGDCCRVSSANITQIARLNNLQVLRLSGECFPSLSSGALVPLGQLSKLTELYLQQNKHVGDMDLSVIASGCRFLEVLSLSAAGQLGIISEGGLCSLSACHRLRELDLSYLSAATDGVLHVIADGCASIRSLRLRCCLSISNVGVITLAKRCAELWELDLSGCLRVSNPGVEPFIRSLQRRASLTLIVGGSSCEPRLLEQLRSGLGQTRIILDTSDLSKTYLLPDNNVDFGDGQSDNADYDDQEGDDDEFMKLCDQPSFVLDKLEEEEDEGPAISGDVMKEDEIE